MNPARSFVVLTMSSMLLLPAGALSTVPTASVHTAVVSEQPVGWTPHVRDGSVKDILRVGDTVVVAGEFTRVADAEQNNTHRLRNLFAFDRYTGEIDTGFAPQVSGTVTSLVEGPDESVVVGGHFSAVNGEPAQGLARLSVGDGSTAQEFGAQIDDGNTYRMAGAGTDLYIGGSFSGVNGIHRTGLARLDTRTGEVDPGFSPTISEQRRGTLRVQELAVSPDGARLAINGTFTKVDGQDRYQIAMIDTADGSVSPWSTSAYEAPCDYEPMHTYMRQMSFAPDGSYFAVVTAGGPHVNPGLCKSTARFENRDTPDAEPTWTNLTGGDSLYSVEATESAVYVGGHQRWMDNEQGALNPGPGAVEREGIAAVDPVSGRALEWNPGRSRGHGVEALYADTDGLYVGSDTERLADAYHARLGMFPAS